MRAKGAIHIHSTLSRDGEMSIRGLADLYAGHGYQFIGISEHAEDMDEAKVDRLIEESRAASRADFLVIPGLEFVCERRVHIVGFGAPRLLTQLDPLRVCEDMREQGGLPILAHPRRYNWTCPPEILRAVHSVEIWNVNYDGKIVPPAKGPDCFRRFREDNPNLLAIAGHDLHRRAGFYDIALELEIPNLTREAVIAAVRAGDYRMISQFFTASSNDPFPERRATWVWLTSWPVNTIRSFRDRIERWVL